VHPRTFLAIAMVGLLVLAGCTGTAPRRGAEGGQGSAIVIGTTDTITSLDPGRAYEYLSINVLWNTMGQLLHYRADSAELVPDLAASMPQVSADGRTYTFTLKSGLTYADGTKLTARDFLHAIQRNSGRIGATEGDTAFLIYDSAKVDVRNSSAPNDTTLVIKLTQPVVFFPKVSVFPNFAPLPRSKYTDQRFVEPTGPTDNLPVSSGPYMITEYRQGESMRLEKNPNYKGAHVAQNEAVVLKFFKTSASLKAAVERGEVDVAYRTFTPGEWNDLEGRSSVRTSEAPLPSPLRFLAFHVPTVGQEAVRQAIAQLIDREEINRVVFEGTYTPAYSIVPSTLQGSKASFQERYGTAPNVQAAQQLLRTAGFSPTNKLRIPLWFNSDGHYGDTEDELATILEAQLERSGLVEVTLQSKPWVAYKADFRQGLYPLFLIGWFPDYLDTDNYLSPFLTEGGARAFGTYYRSATAEALIAQEQQDSNVQTRTETFHQLQDLVAEEVPFIPLVTGSAQVAYKPGTKGVILSPSQLFPYWTLQR
jgi:peptide/nickel transport system substrate-binding protein